MSVERERGRERERERDGERKMWLHNLQYTYSKQNEDFYHKCEYSIIHFDTG